MSRWLVYVNVWVLIDFPVCHASQIDRVRITRKEFWQQPSIPRNQNIGVTRLYCTSFLECCCEPFHTKPLDGITRAESWQRHSMSRGRVVRHWCLSERLQCKSLTVRFNFLVFVWAVLYLSEKKHKSHRNQQAYCMSRAADRQTNMFTNNWELHPRSNALFTRAISALIEWSFRLKAQVTGGSGSQTKLDRQP